jgi:hypothetical protein
MTRSRFTPPLKNGINQHDTFMAGEQISHKGGCSDVPPARLLMPHPTFCDQDFFDIQY